MENDLQKILTKLDEHGKQFDSINQRFDRLEANMNKGFEETADSLRYFMNLSQERFDKLDRSVDNWSQQVDELRDRVRVLETAVQKLQEAIAT